MNNLEIINEQEVLGKQFRVYGTFEEPLFLAKDVAEWIEHSNSRMMLQGIDEDEKICVNNPYALKGQQEQWFLTEDGLYEVLMQSRKPIAKQFKKQVKEILKTLRKKGTYTIPNKSKEIDKTKLAEAKLLNAQARVENAKFKKASLLMKLADINTLSKEYKNILVAKASEVLIGEEIIPLPKSMQKTYTATDLARIFNVSKQMIGKISNQYNLKTKEYGEWYRSKSEYSNKEVDTFVYYDIVLPVLKKILEVA